METRQKTWLDLLGPDVIDCFVSGWEIVRWLGCDGGEHRYEVLWKFATEKEAERCFSAWKEQVKAHRKKVADEKMSSNLISRVVRL